jgi:hypothetical protein
MSFSTGFVAGLDSGTRRAFVPRALAGALLAWGLAALIAMAEKRAAPFGAAGRALEGQVFGLILPIALLWISTRVLEPRRLDASTSGLARFGLSRRTVGLGLIAASMLGGALVAAVAAATTALLAHDPSAPSIALDALTCTWIGALTAAAYAALFALGATFGKNGGGRYWALGFDFLFGGTSGVAALFVPRAHAQNLLGGEPPLLLSQPASAALLVVIAATFTTLALARCKP